MTRVCSNRPLAKIDAADLVADDGDDANAVKEAERNRVRRGGPGEALIALVDPYDLIPGGAGVECQGAAHGVAPDGAGASAGEDRPDFDALFDLCRCGQEETCERCGLSAATIVADECYPPIRPGARLSPLGLRIGSRAW